MQVTVLDAEDTLREGLGVGGNVDSVLEVLPGRLAPGVVNLDPI